MSDSIEQLRALNEQVEALHEADLSQSARLSEAAATFLEQMLEGGAEVSSQLIATTWYLRARSQQEQGEYGAALLNARRALPLFGMVREIGRQADLLRIIGRCYANMGDYSEALTYFVQGLDLAHELDDKQRISRLLISMSTVHYFAGNYEQALQTELQILRLVQGTADDQRGEAIALNNAALTYIRLQKCDLALQYAQGALALVNQMPESGLRGDVLDTMGSVYMAMGNYEQALAYFQQALPILEAGGYRQGQGELRSNIGRVHLALGDDAQALAEVKTAYEIAQQLDARGDVSSYATLLAEIYKYRGEFELALTYYEEAQRLDRELFNQELANRMANLQVVYRTEAAEREAEIYQLKTVELERMVAERTQELSAALEREQNLADELRWALQRETALSQLKSRVIGAVSHEFRTPLTVIATSAALLDKYWERLGEEKRQKQFEKIQDSIRYLDELLRDVLLIDTTNEAEIPIKCQPMTLTAVAEQLAADLAPLSPRIQVAAVAKDAAVSLDYNRVKQIVGAFVSNALKYSEPETVVQIRLELHGSHWRVLVQDAGIGVPLAEQALLFEPFARASNVQAQRGLGLGLHIARRLAEALGGRVWLASPGVNGGSVFGLELGALPPAIQ